MDLRKANSKSYLKKSQPPNALAKSLASTSNISIRDYNDTRRYSPSQNAASIYLQS